MSLETLLIILLIWTVAGLLAAIAFGKAIQETAPREERTLASSAGTIKYFRKHRDKPRDPASHTADSRHGSGKRAAK